MHKGLLFLFFIFHSFTTAWCYNYLSVVKSYDKTDYNAGRQNWDIDIDSYGIVYFGNTDGLLRNVFGIWQLSKTTNNDVVRSLDIHNDTIWCGGDLEFGFFVKNSSANLTYTFIGNAEGGTVWDVQCLDGMVYFQTEGLIMAYNIKTKERYNITSGTGFYNMEVWNDQLWAMSREGKIGIIENGKFEIKYHFNQSQGVEVRKLFVRNNKLYFIHFDGRMFSFDGNEVQQISLPEDIKGQSVFTANSYDSDIYCIGTISNGLVQINEQDNAIISVVNSANNLIDNTVLSVKKAPNGNIWLGLDYGIAYVELQNALRPIFNKGATYYISDYQNTTYLATNKGLFSSKGANPFSFIENSEGQVWKLRQFENDLLVCHTTGLLRIVKGGLVKMYSGDGVVDIANLPGSDYFVVSTYSGLHLAKKIGGKMQIEQSIQRPGNAKLFSDKINKCVWLDADAQTVIKLTLGSDGKLEEKDFENVSRFFDFNDKIIFYNNQVLLQFKNGNFTALTSAPYTNINGPGITSFYEESNGNSVAYVQKGKLNMMVDLHDGTYYSYKKLLSSTEKSLMRNPFIDIRNGELRIGTDRGVTTFNVENTSNRLTNSAPVISKIQISQGENQAKEYTYPYQEYPLEFSAGDKNFTFFFGTHKSSSDVIEYRYLLWPYDNEWSQWSSNANKKEYTKLVGGNYKFTVQSRLNGKIIKDGEVAFLIDSYWYKTKWAIIPYSILFMCCILFTIHIMNRMHKKRIIKQQMQHAQDVVKNNVSVKNQQLLQYAEIISHKNQFLMELKDGLERMRNNDAKRWENKILDEVNSEKKNFFFHKLFSELHQDFINRLTEKHPNLTPHDVRILSFIRINLGTQEIASLMNISPKSVDVTRYRLRKKMELPHATDLNVYIREL